MDSNAENIILSRDCEAVLIPAGMAVTIPAGSVVNITQALGGSYTVYVNGNLARIAGKDADALGREQEDNNATADTVAIEAADATDMEKIRLQIYAQLKTCYDPEIPVDIVELGLIYGYEVVQQDNGEKHANIQMTLTAPGCGMGDFLAEDVRSRVAAIAGIDSVNVELCFEPPWSQEMMSDAARLALGLY